MKNYPLNKYHFYIHGNRVIAASTYAGKVVRGVAVCADSDEFDLEKGKRLAAARCNAKIASKRVKRASYKVIEAREAQFAADRKVEDMIAYYKDASIALTDALREIERIEDET